VGTSFSKGFALSRNIPLIAVNHLQAHVLVHFIKEKNKEKKFPAFPFLCLLVSGGHTQIIIVKDFLDFEIIGQTIDDAAGEAFDKCAKILGLPYPGGPFIDKYAREGNEKKFEFSKPVIKNLDFSFSGLKTSFLYFIRDNIKNNPDFIKQYQNDICASIQKAIIDILMDKIKKAVKLTDIREIAIAGGVSANSGLRNTFLKNAEKNNWNIFIPELKFTTDNAAMVAITGYFKYLKKDFAQQNIVPVARMEE
jgi:N6-L-threonylcarbamoyladenine synthase